MLVHNDRSTIQSLLRAYQRGCCDIDEFVCEARKIIIRFNPDIIEREVGKRIAAILARIPA